MNSTGGNDEQKVFYVLRESKGKNITDVYQIAIDNKLV